jgi:hypothetical protein
MDRSKEIFFDSATMLGLHPDSGQIVKQYQHQQTCARRKPATASPGNSSTPSSTSFRTIRSLFKLPALMHPPQHTRQVES